MDNPMDDVLHAYLRSLRQGGSTTGENTASGPATGASVVATADNDPFLKPSLPFPLSGFVSLVESHREYPASCRHLAEYLKKVSGQVPLDEALIQLMQARLSRVFLERFLLILLEVQPSDHQTAGYALQFRHVRRLLFRVDRRKPLNAAESQLAREIIRALNLHAFADLEPFCAQAVEAFRTVQALKPAASADLGLLLYLLRCEAAAMAERKNWLEGELMPAEPEAIARLSPHLKLLEDRIQRTQELTHRIGRYEPPRDAPMGLENALGPFFFSHFRECLGRRGELAPLLEVIELQRSRLAPTRDLTALASLCRWAHEARGGAGGPLEWIRAALLAYDRGHFRVDLEGALPAAAPLLEEAKSITDGNFALGNFGENPYSTWIARDGLTRPFRSQNPDRLSPDIRHTVIANIHRENILLRLLDNPSVYNTPGLVESVVELSRSPAVHSRIAARTELHAGSVNGRVPVALLKSPVSIPTALLRTLIHPSYVPLAELKSLHRARSSLRPEASEEIARYLRQVKAI
jgi:hypothetical protein